MTQDGYNRYERLGSEHRERGAFDEAGTYYTLAAYEKLGESGFETGMQATDLGIGLHAMLSAALCFRLADDMDRCRNRCRQGICVAEDLRDHVFEDDPSKGLAWEFVGDFRLVGEIGDHDAAYDRAEALYGDEKEPRDWITDPNFEWNIWFLLRMADSADHDIDEFRMYEMFNYLPRRIQYKREEFEDLLGAVLQRGNWKPGY